VFKSVSRHPAIAADWRNWSNPASSKEPIVNVFGSIARISSSSRSTFGRSIKTIFPEAGLAEKWLDKEDVMIPTSPANLRRGLTASF
jgi:hypothetical protein